MEEFIEFVAVMVVVVDLTLELDHLREGGRCVCCCHLRRLNMRRKVLRQHTDDEYATNLDLCLMIFPPLLLLILPLIAVVAAAGALLKLHGESGSDTDLVNGCCCWCWRRRNNNALYFISAKDAADNRLRWLAWRDQTPTWALGNRQRPRLPFAATHTSRREHRPGPTASSR